MRLLSLTSVIAAATMAGPAFAGSITYSNFSDISGITLSGYARQATTSDGTVLQLTPAQAGGYAGNAFSTTTINASNFSTVFQFRITNPGGVQDSAGVSGADGLTFIVQSVSNSAGGSGSGGGYGGINNSVGVKFDTFMNGPGWGGLGDPSSNFVGIYTNGSVNSNGVPTQTVANNFDDGNLWTAWVDYDGTTLKVYADEGTTTKPINPLVTEALNIPTILGQSTAYVGFGGSTGSAWENTDLVNWTYSDVYAPETTAAVPEPASLGLFGVGMIALRLARKRA